MNNLEKFLEDNFYMVQFNNAPMYWNPVLKSFDGKWTIELKTMIAYNKLNGRFTRVKKSLRWRIEDFCRLSWEKQRG